MSFFKSNVVRSQIIVLVFSMLLMVGCVSTLPETSESEMLVASDRVEELADQNEIGINEVKTVNEAPNDIPDHQALAEYQFRLSGGALGHVEDRQPVVIDVFPNQIPDRQALAEYQAYISGGNLGP